MSEAQEVQVAEQSVEPQKDKKGFHYAWIVFAATIIMNFVYSIVYNSFNVYAAGIAENAAFGGDRFLYSLVPTLHSVGATIFLLTYGKIVQKVTFRGVVLLGGVGVALGYVVYSFTNSLFIFYIAALFVGMYPAFCSSSTTGALLNRWFGKYTTTLLSISMAIGGIAGFIGAWMAGVWMESIGYAASFRYLAIIAIVATVITVLIMRNAPKDVNTTILWPSEVDKVATSQEERAGYTFKQAIKTYSFWAIMLFFILFAGSFYAIYSNLGLFMADQGWDATVYGPIFGIISITNVIAMLVGGFIVDKLGPRIAIVALSATFAAIAIMLGFFPITTGAMWVVCGLMGVVWLFAKVLHTPLALVFGNRDTATLIPMMTAAITIGATVGIPLANAIYQATGSYEMLFRGIVVAVVICVVLAVTGVKKAPGWDMVGGPDAVKAGLGQA